MRATPQALLPRHRGGHSRRDSAFPCVEGDAYPVPGIADTDARCVVRAQGCRTLPRVHRQTGLVRQYDFCATKCRFRGSASPLRVWFGPAGSICRRSSSRIRDAGWRLPASADLQDVDSASFKARRSSLVRSSPSSSATRSTTVPSGKVVGSSRTRRPFSTRARRGPISLLNGIPSCSASLHY